MERREIFSLCALHVFLEGQAEEGGAGGGSIITHGIP